VTASFLILFSVYVVHAIHVNRRPEAEGAIARKRGALWLHVPLTLVALYLAFREGVFSRELVSPIHIGLGLAAGHLVFGLSLLSTHGSIGTAVDQMMDLGSLWAFAVENPNVLLRFAGVSLGEELIYRAVAQPILIDMTRSAVFGILLVAAAFCVVHRHFFRNPLGQSAEFVGFAFLIGMLYYFTESFALVLAIHAVRNIEIAYLEKAIEDARTDVSAPPTPAWTGRPLGAVE